MNDHSTIILITIVYAILLIILGAYIYYSYKNQTGLFKYTQPELPNGWQPYGAVTTLTEQEIALRKSILG